MPACTCCTLHWLNWIISSMPCPSVQHLSDNLTMKGWMADMRPRQTAVTTPKWQHQNSPGPIVRGAREPHLIKNLNYRIGMRWPRFWKHHAMGLIQVHTFPLFGIVIELLTCLSRRYPGVNILPKISQPYVLVELWMEITTALKMRKVVYSNFSPVKSTSLDCSASIKLPSGSPSHGLSLDDYSGSQPVGWRAYLA